MGLGGVVPTCVPSPFPTASRGCVPPHVCASMCPCSPPLVSQSHRPHACDRAPLPSRVLVLFSGPIDRPDGLASELRALGFEVVEMDRLAGTDHDIRDDTVLGRVLAAVRAGRFCAVFLGIPCSTYSVARIPQPGEPAEDPPQVRDRWHPLGFPWLDDKWRREVRAANDVTDRAMSVAHVAARIGASVVIENPVWRGEGSPWCKERFRDHASLWDMPVVRRWRHLVGAQGVHCAQCAFGGEFQKLTTFLCTPDMLGALASFASARCFHTKHAEVAHGRGEDGKHVTARAAAYPAALNRALAHALAFPSQPAWPPSPSGCAEPWEGPAYQPFLGPAGMLAGSSRPHAPVGEAGLARAARPTPSSNPRRLEPEILAVLAREPLPRVNVPPVAPWAAGPEPLPHPLPGPLHTHELIPQAVQLELRRFRVQVRACFEAARRGRWRWARDHRPKPLHCSEEDSLLPAGKGFVWLQSPEDGLWRPLEPSSWPHSPPDSELAVGVIIDEAVAMGFPDMEIISLLAHGYPGPELSRETVIGPPHVGALKNAQAFDKCAAKDRRNGWVRWGCALPPVWPMRADPHNIVLRDGKPRMTIDKSMEVVEGIMSYNQSVDLLSQPEIEYVTVGQLGRSAAVLLTAGVKVKFFGFDLEAYFRKTGKQTADIWKSGFCHPDGYGYDPRIQFGQREAPVLCGRQSCFLVAAVRRELTRLESEYPCRASSVIRWLRERLPTTGSDEEGSLQALFFVLIFVDDVGGVCLDDELVDGTGREVWVWTQGKRHRQTRAALYYSAAIGVIRSFGHSDAADKGVPPSLVMDFLGLTLDLSSRTIYLTVLKVDSYLELLRDVKVGGGGAGVKERVFSEFDIFNSLVHKLLHACTAVVLGRQHLFYCLKALRVPVELRSGKRVHVTASAIKELDWWELALERARSEGVPLASRRTFPDASRQGVLTPYSDASRELDSPESSGFGAWAIVAGVVAYVEGRWLPWELHALSINVLELAAMQFGTFTFLEYAASQGCAVSHVMEFTDNTAAEHSAERGRPHTERLSSLVKGRYQRLVGLGVHSSVERVASVDNDVADGLSRGGEKLRDALRIAAGAGMPLKRLEVLAAIRSLSELRYLS